MHIDETSSFYNEIRLSHRYLYCFQVLCYGGDHSILCFCHFVCLFPDIIKPLKPFRNCAKKKKKETDSTSFFQ
ncbi:hypothetical protein CsatA_028173 [Cannabis sativa]